MTSDSLREKWKCAYKLCDKYMDEIHTDSDWSNFAKDVAAFCMQNGTEKDEICMAFVDFLMALFNTAYKGRYHEPENVQQVSLWEGGL